MPRFFAFLTALLIVAFPAHAGTAGRVIFAAGSAHVAGQQASEGALVQEGDLLDTGADGFIYVKTIDDGLFILRPKTQARIVAYFVDAANPVNTRIKLELISGVARSRSGSAVKLARQNFRFNTPVAAIGVRGTDFTVFTDQNTSRVSVISGGIVVSGFGGACRPEGIGPCEGAASKELSSSQRGVLLQVQRGQAAPQLMQGNEGPDHVAPPRADEPVAKSDNNLGTSPALPSKEPSLDPKKSQSLADATETAQRPVVPAPPTVPPPAPGPPVVMPGPDPVVVVPTPPITVPPVSLADSRVIWGRWQPLLGAAPAVDFEKEKATSELVAIKGNFAIFRGAGREFVSPSNGVVGFSLGGGEAYIHNDGSSGPSVESVRLENGTLRVDFGKRMFSTSFDAFTAKEGMTLQASGTVSANGGLFGDQYFSKRGYIDVQGALSNADGGTAAYVFTGRLDPSRTINGVTFWKK